jgi:hypothetical protein
LVSAAGRPATAEGRRKPAAAKPGSGIIAAVGDPFSAWFEALERRHLRELRFSEVRRALQALSSLYVERRARLDAGAALESAGKRAAFALFYGPLHLLTVREIARAKEATSCKPPLLVDLGCGTGAASAGWALACRHPPEILGVERNGWAGGEARWTFGQLGLRARVVHADIARFETPARVGAVLAAFIANELDQPQRGRLKVQLLEAARNGARVLVVEPLARRVTPWWPEWETAFAAEGGQADEWRFRVELPQRLLLLGRAAGLDPRELLARSLWLDGRKFK